MYLLKEIPYDERPRERLVKNGAKSLSIQELIAIILVTGTKNMSVVDVANRVIMNYNNLSEINETTINELCMIEGIGKAKAISLLAAIELGRRIFKNVTTNKIIHSPKDAYEYLDCDMRHLAQENLVSLYLNVKGEVISLKTITIGTINSTVFDAKIIFKWAFKLSAYAIVLAHNHPSGDPTPSANDIEMTNKILEMSKTLEIKIIDHIIIGKDKYFSFLENNKHK